MSKFGQALIAKVREVAALRPQHIDPNDPCLYIYDGQPACIMGCALWDLGVIQPSLEDDGDNQKLIPKLLSRLDLEVDEAEIEWLSAVQKNQDNGLSWGASVEHADLYAS